MRRLLLLALLLAGCQSSDDRMRAEIARLQAQTKTLQPALAERDKLRTEIEGLRQENENLRLLVGEMKARRGGGARGGETQVPPFGK